MMRAWIWVGMGLWTFAAFGAPEMIWDVEWAKTAPLDVQVTSEVETEHEGTPLIVRELSFFSHEWNGETIRIAGHLAMPPAAKTSPLPAIIFVTSGLGEAKRRAAENGIVALSIDRVGEGDSTGPADIYENWLDLAPEKDIRNSWMYHFVMSGVRAVTYLSELPEVRADRIGISGISRGGICSLLVSAIDDRIALAVPIAATGDFGRTVYVDDNWLLSLVIRPVGQTLDSIGWKRFIAQYDPVLWKDRFHGFIYVLVGAQDEFFPVTSAAALMEGLDDTARLELLYDADHGYYGIDLGLFDTYNNNEAIWTRIDAGLEAAIRYALLGTGSMPKTPTLTVETKDGEIAATVRVDAPDRVVGAQLVYSTNGAWTFERAPMARGEEPNAWHVTAALPKGDSLAAFVEVEYEDDAGNFYLTSLPYLSEGFVPKIRPAVMP